MAILDEVDAGAIENCVDDLGECIARLDRYSEAELAHSLALHLTGLLGALREAGQCSNDDVRRFLSSLHHQVERDGP